MILISFFIQRRIGAARIGSFCGQQFLEADICTTGRNPLKGVGNGVSRDINAGGRNTFSGEVPGRLLCWREVPRRDGTEQAPVHFFREWRIIIVRSEARFNVADWQVMVKPAESPEQSARSVPLDQHCADLMASKELSEP